MKMLSALDPGKQGLKLFNLHPHHKLRFLSALDPGKQGLKLCADCFSRWLWANFQRLIQENKD